MKKLLLIPILFFILSIICLAWASDGYCVATKMYGRDARTGGTKSLDNLLANDLVDGDMAVVGDVSTGLYYFYKYDDDSAATANGLSVVVPLYSTGTTEYTGDGRWLSYGIGGLGLFDPVGGIKAQTPLSGTAALFDDNFTGAYLYGGTYKIITTQGVVALPTPLVGMNFTIINTLAATSTINPYSTTDTIIMNGLSMAQDEDLTTATVGAMCVFQYSAANTWEAICIDWAEATPPA